MQREAPIPSRSKRRRKARWIGVFLGSLLFTGIVGWLCQVFQIEGQMKAAEKRTPWFTFTQSNWNPNGRTWKTVTYHDGQKWREEMHFRLDDGRVIFDNYTVWDGTRELIARRRPKGMGWVPWGRRPRRSLAYLDDVPPDRNPTLTITDMIPMGLTTFHFNVPWRGQRVNEVDVDTFRFKGLQLIDNREKVFTEQATNRPIHAEGHYEQSTSRWECDCDYGRPDPSLFSTVPPADCKVVDLAAERRDLVSRLSPRGAVVLDSSQVMFLLPEASNPEILENVSLRFEGLEKSPKPLGGLSGHTSILKGPTLRVVWVFDVFNTWPSLSHLKSGDRLSGVIGKIRFHDLPVERVESSNLLLRPVIEPVQIPHGSGVRVARA